jgi:hypothetical protein
LIEGFIDPSREAFLAERLRVKAMRNVCDVVIGAEGEDDGFESSVGNGRYLRGRS